MEKKASDRLTRAEGRRFAVTVGLAFAAITAVLVWRGRDTAAVVTGALAAALLLAGLLVPGHLTPVHRAWMGMATIISKVTTPLVLGVIYFIVIAPVGLALRLLGRPPIDLRAGARPSYWVPAERPRSDLKRQF